MSGATRHGSDSCFPSLHIVLPSVFTEPVSRPQIFSIPSNLRTQPLVPQGRCHAAPGMPCAPSDATGFFHRPAPMRPTPFLGALALSAVVILMPGSLPAQSGIVRVWAVDDGEKVRADDLQHWAASDPANPVWDGSTVRLSGARNEIVAFQVILESSSQGASAVNVTLDTLRGDTHLITNTGGIGDPFDYVGKRIERFVEQYIHVTDRSPWNGSWGWWGARPLPDAEHTGWIPDALVPAEAPSGVYDHGSGGMPLSISPNMNQGVWIDIYIDKTVPPGWYEGLVRVSEGGRITHTMPVRLQVYGFTLSDTTHLKNFADIPSQLIELHGVTRGTPEYWSIFQRYMNLGHRHRMDFTDGGVDISSFRNDLAGYYTGDRYTSAQAYQGPGVSVGNGVYSIGTYDQPEAGYVSGFWPETDTAWQKASDAWELWFHQNADNVLRFKYMSDEPQPSAFGHVIERAGWIRNGPGPGRNLRVFCTAPMAPALRGSVNVWALTSQSGYVEGSITYGYMPATAETLRAAGNLVGIYNGTRPAYGQMSALDNFATDCRVTPWIAWRYNVDFYFLWEIGQYAASRKNSWVDQYWILDGKKMWGDGQFIYAGEDNLFPGDNRRIRGPIASIRLKNWRRGQQDFEYLWLARQRGISIDAYVDEVVPRAFDDYDGVTYRTQGDQPVWATRGYVFERARKQVAELLEGGTKTTLLPKGAIAAQPAHLPAGGGDILLTWSSTDASTASIDQGLGSVGAQGNRTVRVTVSTTFTLTVTNEAGTQQALASVTVDAPDPGAPNLVRNGGFELGAEYWEISVVGSSTFQTCSLSVARAHVSRLRFSADGDSIQLSQAGIHLEPRTIYQLSFEAYSPERDSVDLSIQRQNDPTQTYGLGPFGTPLDALWARSSFQFATPDWSAPVEDGRIVFWIPRSSHGGGQVILDNIALTKIRGVLGGDTVATVPVDYLLEQNYPNPFNPSTLIRVSLPAATRLRLEVFDLLGRLVTTLVDEDLRAGWHEFRFLATNLSAGVYYYRLVTPEYSETRRMILLK
jgi:hypothetical protein